MKLPASRSDAFYGTVSNPWREAIEVCPFIEITYDKRVSNPWREAIEVRSRKRKRALGTVSNPWREAIEGIRF